MIKTISFHYILTQVSTKKIREISQIFFFIFAAKFSIINSILFLTGNPDALCNLFGYYGDVHKVKILRNKPDCALIQMAKPHQVFTIRQNLDQLKLYGKKICVSFSRVESIKMPRYLFSSWANWPRARLF